MLKLLFVLLVFLTTVRLTCSKPSCDDECGLKRAEHSLKLALGVIKLIEDGDNEGNGIHNDSDNGTITNDKNPKTEVSTETTSSAFQLSTSSTKNPLDTNNEPVPPSNSTSINNDKCSDKENSKLAPSNCAEIMVIGYKKSGVYNVYPKWQTNVKPYQVYCDMKTGGGGWTVVQRREPEVTGPRQPFNMSWVNYKKGFGNLSEEFWLGNDNIYKLTTQDRMILRLELEDWEGQKRFAHYKVFIIGTEEEKYRMKPYTIYDNTIGGDCVYAGNSQFVTFDNDQPTNKPAKTVKAGFWYNDWPAKSIISNLNGVYYLSGSNLNRVDGIYCSHFRGMGYSLKKVEMKLRPEYFSPSEDE